MSITNISCRFPFHFENPSLKLKWNELDVLFNKINIDDYFVGVKYRNKNKGEIISIGSFSNHGRFIQLLFNLHSSYNNNKYIKAELFADGIKCLVKTEEEMEAVRNVLLARISDDGWGITLRDTHILLVNIKLTRENFPGFEKLLSYILENSKEISPNEAKKLKYKTSNFTVFHPYEEIWQLSSGPIEDAIAIQNEFSSLK